MKKGFISALMLLLLFAAGQSVFASGESDGPDVLTVELFSRDITGLDLQKCYQSQFIQQSMKDAYGIKVRFLVVPRWSDVEKLNVMMAAGDAPDLCLLYDIPTISNYIQSGGLCDLGPALEKYGQNIKKYLGKDVLDYGVWNGVQYTIPGKRPVTPAQSFFVRKDWLDALGMKIPTTKDEFYKVLKAFKEKNPGNVDNLIPYGFGIDEANIDWTNQMLVWSFVKKMSPEEFASKYNQGRWVMPGYKEAIRFLNKLYNEGLIYKDFFLDGAGDQFAKEVMQGNVGSFGHNFDMPYRQSPGWVRELKKNVPTANLVPMDPFENYEGKHVKSIYPPAGINIMVPIFHQDKVESVIKYIDWMASDPAIVKKLQNGELGKQYMAETEDGIPIEKIAVEDLPNDLKFQWHDFSIITTGSFEYGDQAVNIKAQAMSYPGFENEIVRAMEIAFTDSFIPPHFNVVIESEAKYTPNLNAKGAEIYVKSITADPAEFDEIYDTLVKEYMEMGGQIIIDEKLAAYRAQMGK
ncbi:MAG: extracellular solute-binding protein [Spirochaetales bacterium]|nr:extracellular solute-binding protein [Spirochaetales bacterium]